MSDLKRAGKILVFGGHGQLAKALANDFATNDMGNFVFKGSAEVNFCNLESLLETLELESPKIVINASAYTAVDLAESEIEKAEKINVVAPKVISEWCKRNNAILVHYSSDYVYGDEQTEQPHLESEAHKPLNFYGQTKASGDEAIVKSGCEHLIFRTSWVYAEKGKNFLQTMLKLANKEELRIVSDQVGAPSYAKDLAEGTLKALNVALLKAKFPSGVYHLANSGQTNWAEFASNIFEEAMRLKLVIAVPRIIRIMTEEYPTPAKRPKNSKLNCTKFENEFGFKLRNWDDALKDAMSRIKEI